MPSTVEKLGDNRVKLTITISAEELKPHLDRAYRSIGAQLNIPGFRKGKVPAAVIDQRFGKGAVLQEAVNEVLPQAFSAALGEHNIKPLGQPEIEMVSAEPEVVFAATVNTVPEFDLPDVSQVTVEVEKAETSEADLDERVNLLRERFATYADVERAAQTGDVVTVDLVGSQDGAPMEDATAEGVSFKIGGGNMLDGLDDAVTGLKVGESKEFRSTLVGGAKKDEEADIKVTVTKIQEQTLPELDDDFAQMVSEFDTVDEMKADLRDGVEKMALAEQANAAKDKILEELVKSLDFELPAELIEAERAGRRENINSQLVQVGMSLEKYLEENEDGRSVEDFWAEVDGRATDGIKAQLLLDKYSDDRQVSVDQQDLTEHLFRRAQANGTSPEAEAQHMMEHDHLGEWMGEIRRTKALAQMVSEATVKDTEGKVLDMTPLAPKAPEAPQAPEAPAVGDAPAADEAAEPAEKPKKAKQAKAEEPQDDEAK